MKRFIKENWFKVSIILLILVVVFVYLFAYFLPKSNQTSFLKLQEKCMQVGRDSFKSDLLQGAANNYFEPRYGYNKNLNTCIYSGGYGDIGNSSEGVSEGILKHNCNAHWEQWVKNSYTNEKIIQIYNLNDSKCEWTAKTEKIEKFQNETDELFNYK